MDSSSRRRAIAAAVGVVALIAIAIACTNPGGPRPPRTTTTSTTTDTRPGTVDCGTINYASGAPTTRLVLIEPYAQCLLANFEPGTPARLATINEPGGAGNVLYEVIGPRLLRVTSPSLVQHCTNLSYDTSTLRPGMCTPQPPAAPPLAGEDCGTILYSTGWPTVPPITLGRAGECFMGHWATGTPARITTRDQTDGNGGHIRIVIYDVLGTGQLRITTDNRQAQPPGPVVSQRCTGLTASISRLQPQGCTTV
jgi:hypothetical protein